MKRALVAAAAFLSLAGCGISYSDGVRVGHITKFSYKGILCKVWEGEMNLGGLRRKSQSDTDGNYTGSMVANVWGFTVTDSKHIKQIQEAMESGKQVQITYTQKILYNPCSTSTGYFVTKVQ